MSQCHYIKYDELGEKEGKTIFKKHEKETHQEAFEQLIKLQCEKSWSTVKAFTHCSFNFIKGQFYCLRRLTFDISIFKNCMNYLIYLDNYFMAAKENTRRLVKFGV